MKGFTDVQHAYCLQHGTHKVSTVASFKHMSLVTVSNLTPMQNK